MRAPTHGGLVHAALAASSGIRPHLMPYASCDRLPSTAPAADLVSTCCGKVHSAPALGRYGIGLALDCNEEFDMQLAGIQTRLQGQLTALIPSKCTCESRCLGARGGANAFTGILLLPGVAEGLGPKHFVGCLLLRAAKGRSRGKYKSKPLSARHSLQASNTTEHGSNPTRRLSSTTLSKKQRYSPGSFAGERRRGDALGANVPIRDIFNAAMLK